MENLLLQTYSVRPDGTKDTFQTIELETKIQPLWWQERGLSFTATGYGKRIPTSYCVRFNGKWRRVYCAIYSNIGTCYIGKLSDNLIIR
jgi:hypothetical protein